MTEKYKPIPNRDTIKYYYDYGEKGYLDFLKGVCHYGYSGSNPEDSDSDFDMSLSQLEMERKLGEALGLSRGSRVLDAGSGYGPVSRTLTREFGYKVTGIDLLEKRLQHNSKLNADAEMDTIGLANADYHFLPFADESFDGVFTMETLVHAYDFELVLAEFLRVLKPGGKVVLFEYSIPELESVPAVARIIAQKVIDHVGMASLQYFTHGSFPTILEKAGFENITSEDISRSVYPSWFYLWKFAVRVSLARFARGEISFKSIPGSMWIWPARKKLGYNISQGTKPV